MSTHSGADQLTVMHVFPTFAVGGAQVRFAAIANRFGRAYRHLIVSMDGRDACRERLSPDLDVTYPALPIRKQATLANAFTFRRALRMLHPDVLVTCNWGALEWALANLWPIVRHIHVEDGFGPEERETQLRRRVLMRRLVLRRSTVVLPSRNLYRIATEQWRLNEQRVRYIPNGIDLKKFTGERDHAAQAGFAGDGPVIGTVAVLRAEKNLERLIHAFHHVVRTAPARLVIVGDGPERTALQRLAQELELADRTHFTGHVQDPAQLYAAFDVFALSSDTEQMPFSVMEAMAAGLPVASTDVGDVRAMLPAGNQDFIGPLDGAALATSILRLLRDPPLRAQIGAANRAQALRDFDEETMFSAYAALLSGTAQPAPA